MYGADAPEEGGGGGGNKIKKKNNGIMIKKFEFQDNFNLKNYPDVGW